MNGRELCGRYYADAVAPLLAGVPHAAVLLGEGSEVLGYDDGVSTDHDFGPRVQILVGSDVDGAARMLAGHAVEVRTVGGFFVRRIGVDPAAGMALVDWLCTPTQLFAALTAGAVYHDPAGAVAARRRVLSWYPDDVWRYVLAAGWCRVAQEAPFVGRAGARGDDLGSAVLAGRLVRDLMRLAFLVSRRWAPYPKWFGLAFAELPPAAGLAGPLAAAVRAVDWRTREAALCEAARVLGTATNRLGLCAPVDPTPRRFFERDIRVPAADGYVAALTASITDPSVGALVARLGTRGAGVAALPGAVDQVVDNVDVLSHVDRCRAMAPALGLMY